MMVQGFEVLTHSSIRIIGSETLYFDPFRVNREYHDAGIIFITHEHYDHFSPEDIAKVKNDSSVLICPRSMYEVISASGISEEFIELVEPGDELSVNDVKIEAVCAYNVGKQFHPKEKNWVGYIVTMDNIKYFVAGDTDLNEDNQKVTCDVAFLPVGGTYTMTAEEAAQLALIIKPSQAVPTHFGSVVGSADDGIRFNQSLSGRIAALEL